MTPFKNLLAAAALTLALSTAAAHAQLAPYAMFSASHYSGIGVGVGTTATESGGITPLGGTFGVQDDVLHAGPLAVGLDVRGMVQNSANSTPYGDKLAGFLVGGRLAANAIVLPFRPYAQLEIGAVATNNGTQTNKSTGFAYQFQFGGDFTIIPHLGARLEYGAGQVTSNSINHTLQTFGAGLVIRL
jgi:hypothetical protein